MQALRKDTFLSQTDLCTVRTARELVSLQICCWVNQKTSKNIFLLCNTKAKNIFCYFLKNFVHICYKLLNLKVVVVVVVVDQNEEVVVGVDQNEEVVVGVDQSEEVVVVVVDVVVEGPEYYRELYNNRRFALA